MSEDATHVARIELPDGTPVWARISGAEGLLPRPRNEGSGGYVDSGRRDGADGGSDYVDSGFFSDRVLGRMESLDGLVHGVARSLAGALQGLRPDEVSVQFGIELSGKSGTLVGLLADGEAKAAINVTLTWQGGPPADLAEGGAGGGA
ncbi:CU044_2847 family protein [Streptomyces ochraceiscleroticus]|uniref:CU044_2847 family protein n=1 Tax=Streptomyces ochraceiscleroticus TaxID=47761 RepID=A0ABW1MCV9_9ACTN|nr:CU044_2847 family protein [Streptomyces ochraceiscleroticus]